METAASSSAGPASPSVAGAEPQKPPVYEHLLRDEGSELHNAFDRVMRPLLIGAVGLACKTVMRILNNTVVYGEEKFMEAVHNRPPGVPLITVSNHITALDDPLVPGMLLPFRTIIDSKAVRWTLCATDRCFKDRFMTEFFKYTKVLPVKRGAGLDQAGMGVALQKLNRGDWLHVFPEGTRSRDGQMGPVRLGIGRLVTAPDVPPIVLPFYMSGIEEVLPVSARMFGVGHDVRILFGDPIDLRDVLARHPTPGREAFREIADRVAHSMRGLRDALDRMAADELRASLAAFRASEGAIRAMGRLGLVDADGSLFGLEPAPVDASLFVPIRPRTLTLLLRDAARVEAALAAPPPAPAHVGAAPDGHQEPVDNAPEPRRRRLAELRQRARDRSRAFAAHWVQRARDAPERIRTRYREIRARAAEHRYPLFTPMQDLLARARSEFSAQVPMLSPPPGGLASSSRPPRSPAAAPSTPPRGEAGPPPISVPPASPYRLPPESPLPATPRVKTTPRAGTTPRLDRSRPGTPALAPASPADPQRQRRSPGAAQPALSPLYASLFDPPPRITHVLRRLL